jgi:hypothetical protein
MSLDEKAINKPFEGLKEDLMFHVVRPLPNIFVK